MNYRVKNWTRYQHYGTRNPPWIKLHRQLLDDWEFRRLPLSARALAPMLWLLASGSENGDFDGPEARIADRLGWPERDLSTALKSLIDAGFIIETGDLIAHASIVQTAPEQRAPADCPHEQIIAAYHELLPGNPRVRFWTASRRGYLRARWLEDPKRQSLDWWRRYFEHVSRSPFLTGKTNGRGDQPPFVATLEWLVKPSNMVKVIEGNYDRSN